MWAYDKALLAHSTIVVRATALLVAQLACGPIVVQSKPRASSGFIYRAAGCQAPRPQGWSVNGKEDFTPTPGLSKTHQTTVTKKVGFSLCELPAAVLFKELTWHWYNVRTLTMRTTFDLGNTFWSVRRSLEAGKMKSQTVAPGSKDAAEELVSNSSVSGITLWCQTRPKRDKMRRCVIWEGCRVSVRARAGSSHSAFFLRGNDSAINSPAKVGWVGGKRSFDCFTPGSLSVTRQGVENKTEHK